MHGRPAQRLALVMPVGTRGCREQRPDPRLRHAQKLTSTTGCPNVGHKECYLKTTMPSVLRSSLPAALGATAALLLSPAHAAPVTWSLNSVTTVGTGLFAGVPGSLTGTFDYDASTNTYSNILIRNTPNDVEPTPLTFSTFSSGDSGILVLLNGGPDPDGGIGRHTLTLDFVGNLSDLGGSITLDTATSFATYFTGIRRSNINGGTVEAAPGVGGVPEPASLALVLSALGLAAGLGRKRC